MVNMLKQAAGLETANFKEFEEALSKIAIRYLEGVASELLPDFVGFQLLKKTEDNTHAIGVCGFKVNEEWIYVPIFWLKGELKGNELMFISSQNQFVPLDDGWVSYILSRQNPVLGEGTGLSLSQLGGGTPSTSRVRDTIFTTTGTGKFGSLKPWAQKFVEKVAGAVNNPNGLNDIAEFANKEAENGLSLPTFLRENLKQCKVAFDKYANYPAVEYAIDKVHGINLFSDILKDWADKTAEEDSQPKEVDLDHSQTLTSLNAFKDLDAQYSYSIETSEVDGSNVKTKKVEVVVASPNSRKNYFTYSNNQRQDLVRQGYTVMDSRDDDEVAVRYITGRSELKNPCHSGVYEVIRENGDIVKCLIILRPDLKESPRYITRFPSDSPLNGVSGDIDVSGNFRVPVVITTLDGRSEWWMGFKDDVWVTKVVAECFSDMDKLEDLKTVTSMKESGLDQKGHFYAILGSNGQGLGPFYVTDKGEDETYDVTFKSPREIMRGCCYTSIGREPNHLVIGRKSSSKKFIYNRDFVYAPKDAIIVDLGTHDICGDWDTFHPADVNDVVFMRGGTSAVNTGQITKTGSILPKHEVSTFKVFVDPKADAVYINDFSTYSSLSKMAALIKLIEDPSYNFKEETARDIIKEATAEGYYGRALKVLYKQAAAMAPLDTYQPPDPNDFRREPQFQDPPYSYDSGIDNFRIKHNTAQVEKVEDHSMSPAVAHMEQLGPALDPLAFQRANQAAEEGDNFGFDTSMIASLIKETSDDEDVFKKYTSTFMKALDRSGRLLFFYYSKHDQMRERLGDALMPDVERSIQNTFNNLGELTLILKRTDVGPSPNLVDFSPAMSMETGSFEA